MKEQIASPEGTLDEQDDSNEQGGGRPGDQRGPIRGWPPGKLLQIKTARRGGEGSGFKIN